jgi:hypothetical protein
MRNFIIILETFFLTSVVDNDFLCCFAHDLKSTHVLQLAGSFSGLLFFGSIKGIFLYTQNNLFSKNVLLFSTRLIDVHVIDVSFFMELV